MSYRSRLLVALSVSAACTDPSPDPPAIPDAGMSVDCDDAEFGLTWRPETDLVPTVTVPDDGFYGLPPYPRDDGYDVLRYDPAGAPSVVATLPALPTTGTRLFARDGAVHYARIAAAEIRHGAVGGDETVVQTGVRSFVAVEAADLGGLFVAFREPPGDAYAYAVYDGSEERFREASTWDTSVHPRSGGSPVIARLTEDGRLLAGAAGEPMTELTSSAGCAATRHYAVVALADGGIAWAHACPPDDARSFVGLRAPGGESVSKELATLAGSVSLAEGPGGTILAAFVVAPGELSLRLFDGALEERAASAIPVVHVVTSTDTEYEFPLTEVSLSLSRSTIGPTFTIGGSFDIPDGRIDQLAFGTLCGFADGPPPDTLAP